MYYYVSTFSMDYGPITLDLSYFCTNVLLAIADAVMKAVLENIIVYLFIGLTMRIFNVNATEKVIMYTCNT